MRTAATLAAGQLYAGGMKCPTHRGTSAWGHGQAGSPWPVWLFALLAIAALIAAIAHFSELERFADLACQARPAWMLAAIALRYVTWAAVAATLLLRDLTVWIPLVPGLFLMRRAAAGHIAK